MAHDQVQDEIVDRVHQRIQDGMGLIVLHSGHASKIFRKVWNQFGYLKWRGGREGDPVGDRSEPSDRGRVR